MTRNPSDHLPASRLITAIKQIVGHQITYAQGEQRSRKRVNGQDSNGSTGKTVSDSEGGTGNEGNGKEGNANEIGGGEPRNHNEEVDCPKSARGYHRYARFATERHGNGEFTSITRCRYCSDLKQVYIGWTTNKEGRRIAYQKVYDVEKMPQNQSE
jgi:hypothetical protein